MSTQYSWLALIRSWPWGALKADSVVANFSHIMLHAETEALHVEQAPDSEQGGAAAADGQLSPEEQEEAHTQRALNLSFASNMWVTSPFLRTVLWPAPSSLLCISHTVPSSPANCTCSVCHLLLQLLGRATCVRHAIGL